MNRRTVLTAGATAVSTAIATAGCLDSTHPDGAASTGGSTRDRDGRVVDHFDDGPTRPECEVDSGTVEVRTGEKTRERETAETVAYPDPPDAFDRETAFEYVESFEHAYVTHDVLCARRNSVLDVGFGVQSREPLNRHDDVRVVVLWRSGGAESGVDGDGYLWMAGLPIEEVVYAVDDSGVARAVGDGSPHAGSDDVESRAPDPLEEGELVAVFE